MTCKQLGGACDKEFHAETFDKMAELSKKHGLAMFKALDTEHLNAMAAMKELMSDPSAMEDWYCSKLEEFNSLPDIAVLSED